MTESVGIRPSIPCFSEAWKNSVNVGVSSSASVLSNVVCIRGLVRMLCVLLSVHSSL